MVICDDFTRFFFTWFRVVTCCTSLDDAPVTVFVPYIDLRQFLPLLSLAITLFNLFIGDVNIKAEFHLLEVKNTPIKLTRNSDAVTLSWFLQRWNNNAGGTNPLFASPRNPTGDHPQQQRLAFYLFPGDCTGPLPRPSGWPLSSSHLVSPAFSKIIFCLFVFTISTTNIGLVQDHHNPHKNIVPHQASSSHLEAYSVQQCALHCLQVRPETRFAMVSWYLVVPWCHDETRAEKAMTVFGNIAIPDPVGAEYCTTFTCVSVCVSKVWNFTFLQCVFVEPDQIDRKVKWSLAIWICLQKIDGWRKLCQVSYRPAPFLGLLGDKFNCICGMVGAVKV